MSKAADLSHIAEDLRPLAVAVSKLKPDPKNVRTHSERNIRAVMASLKRYGQRKPIVALKAGTIVAGNGTFEAAKRLAAGSKELGLDADPRWLQVAVSRFESKEDAVAYAIADNKTAELADWDYEGLAEQLRDMDEDLRGYTGFAPHEIEPLLAAEWEPPKVEPLPDRSSGHHVSLNEEQWAVFNKAVEKVRGRDEKMTRGDALKAICEGWLELA